MLTACGRGLVLLRRRKIRYELPVLQMTSRFKQWALWRMICIPKPRERNGQNLRIDSNQILFNDKDQQAYIGRKVCYLRLLFSSDLHLFRMPVCRTGFLLYNRLVDFR